IEETLQRLQDSCIRTNVLYGTDIWVSIPSDKLAQIFRLRELGLLDALDVPVIPKNKREEQQFMNLLKTEGFI
ncbi:MAG: hypothetical protein KH847_10845, partial [Clostridiales bacterium]|nr:hypothetical protein [Clostridiales bacterium]